MYLMAAFIDWTVKGGVLGRQSFSVFVCCASHARTRQDSIQTRMSLN